MTTTPPARDWPFFAAFGLLGGLYVGLIVAAVAALVARAAGTSAGVLTELADPHVQHALALSLTTSSVSTVLALWVAVPLGYLLARTRFPGRPLIDLVVDIPVVLPPVVVGLCLLLLFQTGPGVAVRRLIPVTHAVPGIVLAQFTVTAAFAVRTMRVTFEQIPRRTEDVARTLGCTRGQAFWWVTFPQARRGLLAAATTTWARALGEFGPILVFVGVERGATEVLPTSVFLAVETGRLATAFTVSVLMIVVAVAVLALMRGLGVRAGGP